MTGDAPHRCRVWVAKRFCSGPPAVSRRAEKPSLTNHTYCSDNRGKATGEEYCVGPSLGDSGGAAKR